MLSGLDNIYEHGPVAELVKMGPNLKTHLQKSHPHAHIFLVHKGVDTAMQEYSWGSFLLLLFF